MLGRLCFELARRGDERHQRQVHKSGLIAPETQTHLTRGLKERQRFNISDCATDFDHGDIGLTLPGLIRTTGNEILDFIGDVGDHLHRFA